MSDIETPESADTTLERWGVTWKGHDNAVCERMPDGYWTPWHIAYDEVMTLRSALAEARGYTATAAARDKIDTALATGRSADSPLGLKICPTCYMVGLITEDVLESERFVCKTCGTGVDLDAGDAFTMIKSILERLDGMDSACIRASAALAKATGGSDE